MMRAHIYMVKISYTFETAGVFQKVPYWTTSSLDALASVSHNAANEIDCRPVVA